MCLSIIPLLFVAQYKYGFYPPSLPPSLPLSVCLSVRTHGLPLFLILPMRTRSSWTTGTMMRDITVSKRQLATNLASTWVGARGEGTKSLVERGKSFRQ